MSIYPPESTPNMPIEHQPYYLNITQRTALILSDFAKTKPKDEKKIIDVFSQIRKLDEAALVTLNKNQPESLCIPVYEEASFSLTAPHPDHRKDPITSGLIDGDAINPGKEPLIFKSKIEGFFIKVTHKYEPNLNRGSVTQSFLIGSNDADILALKEKN